MKNINYMNEAVKEAEEGIAAKHGGPFGSVIVRNGEIIGRGHNRVIHSNDPTAHGEVEAIRDACRRIQSFDLSGAELYTTCYPCPMCLGAVMWARIQRVYYCCDSFDAAIIGFDDSQFYIDLNDPKFIKQYLVYDESSKELCDGLFKKYHDDKNNKRY